MDKNERGFGARLSRRCALTKEAKPDYELIRFVANECGEVFADVNAKAPGRGVWISADKASLETAIKTNAFARSLKRNCFPKPELLVQTQNALVQKCLSMLGFAKRSGEILFGFDTVLDSVKNKKPAFIIEAQDSADDGRDKILRAAYKKWGEIEIIGCFDNQSLSQVLGRENVIHAVFLKGIFAQNWGKEISRLGGFIELLPNEWRINDAFKDKDLEMEGAEL